MGIEVTENTGQGVRGVREKFRKEDSRSRIELSVSDKRGVNTEEEKRGSLLEVDYDAEIV